MWQVYLIRCRDQSLYTGVTNDLSRRIRQHEAEGPACAKYLRGKGPFALVFTCIAGSRSDALKAERRIKKLSKDGKERLIAGRLSLADVI